jgi:hypothetical protein
MFLNAMHMRFAAIGAGVVLLVLFFVMGGSFGQPEVIQLDYSMYPETLEGARVEIDGNVVGALERTGQTTRAGFKVKKGHHVVRVLHPEIPAADIEVEVRPGEKVRVLLDMVERYDHETGRSSTVIGGQL